MAKEQTIQDRVLRLADIHSPEEISRELGGVLSPAKVRLLLNDLLSKNGRTWMDDDQREELLLYRLSNVIEKFEDMTLAGSIEHAKVYLAYLRTVKEMLDKRQAQRQVDLNALYANQAQIMFDAVKIATAGMVSALRDDFPELTQERAALAMDEALPQAVLAIAERNLGDEVQA